MKAATTYNEQAGLVILAMLARQHEELARAVVPAEVVAAFDAWRAARPAPCDDFTEWERRVSVWNAALCDLEVAIRARRMPVTETINALVQAHRR